MQEVYFLKLNFCIFFQEIIYNTKNLDVIESSVDDILLNSNELNSSDNEMSNSISGCILNNGYV